jgi:hypothetical protein
VSFSGGTVLIVYLHLVLLLLLLSLSGRLLSGLVCGLVSFNSPVSWNLSYIHYSFLDVELFNALHNPFDGICPGKRADRDLIVGKDVNIS